ncbi:MAG: mucoidy inhibitor MuiA family protein [Cyanobacteria bacterium P01_A01_bin.45]
MVNSEVLPQRQIVESQIVEVTVYSDQALVTRRSLMKLTGEEKELVINHLPVTLKSESVRVKGKGSVGVKLQEVSTEKIYVTEPVVDKVAQLSREIEQLQVERRSLQAQVDALVLQSDFIRGLREKTEDTFAQSLSRKNLSLSETLDLLNFLGSQYSEYAIATSEYKHRQQEIDTQIEATELQLQAIETPNSKESVNIIVGIEAAGAGEFELEVSYVVTNATWIPLYDIRVDSDRKKVNLSYLAEITQNTGEDWIDVSLILSTAKPGSGTLPPKPEPWYIDIISLRSPRSQASLAAPQSLSAPKRKLAFSEDMSRKMESEDEEVFQKAEIVKAEVLKTGSIVNFQISHQGNIPSDNYPHKTTIAYEDYPCSFEHIAMPRLVSFAYLQTKVKNSSDGITLLPGKANIFRDNTFVGTTQLENIAPGQEFRLNLGIDESTNIERELVERHVDKKLIGSNRKITYAYKLIITNLLDKEASLQLTEQLPVSRNEQIKVRLNRTQPQIQPGEMGNLDWQLILQPQTKHDVYYQFTVEHPPQLAIEGLEM